MSTRSCATPPTRPASARPADCSRITSTPSSTCLRRAWTPATPAPTRCPTPPRAWRNALDATVLSAVLTVQTVGDHLRSGGSIISVVAENPPAGSVDAAIKAALSSWTAGPGRRFSAPAASP